MPSARIQVCIDPDDKKRVEDYLNATYKGSVSSFAYRLMMEKVIEWEERQERRRNAQAS